MKTKEIIAQLQIEKGLGFKKQKDFFAILIEELKAGYKAFGNEDSERHFDAAVKNLRTKWDSISRQIRNGLDDKMWNFLYATEIVPLKNELCPTWAKRKQEEHERYLRRREKQEQREARKGERCEIE